MIWVLARSSGGSDRRSETKTIVLPLWSTATMPTAILPLPISHTAMVFPFIFPNREKLNNFITYSIRHLWEQVSLYSHMLLENRFDATNTGRGRFLFLYFERAELTGLGY